MSRKGLMRLVFSQHLFTVLVKYDDRHDLVALNRYNLSSLPAVCMRLADVINDATLPGNDQDSGS